MRHTNYINSSIGAATQDMGTKNMFFWKWRIMYLLPRGMSGFVLGISENKKIAIREFVHSSVRPSVRLTGAAVTGFFGVFLIKWISYLNWSGFLGFEMFLNRFLFSLFYTPTFIYTFLMIFFTSSFFLSLFFFNFSDDFFYHKFLVNATFLTRYFFIFFDVGE